MGFDYTSVTEITGCNVTSEQLQIIYARYRFASELCDDKEVLESACAQVKDRVAWQKKQNE